MDRKKRLFLILGIFVLAFTIRFINLETIKDNPFFDYLIMDEKYHDEWATEIASGNLFARTPFYRAPLYPYFLGLVYSVFGHSYYLGRLVGIILGSLSCVFIFLLAQELFSRRVAILSGVLASLYSMFLFFDTMLLTVGLEVLLSVVSVYLFIKWLKSRKKSLLLSSGLILGLAAITRPNFLIFIPIAFIYIIIKFKELALKERFITAIYFLIIAIIPVVCITIINCTVGNDFVPIAWNGGINFYLGNNPHASGWSATAPGIDATWWGGYRDAIIIAEGETGRNLAPSEVSNYWFGKGLEFIASNPLGWLGLIVKKSYLLLNTLELKNNVSIKTFKSFSPLLRLPVLNFGTIAALALSAIALIKKRITLNLVLVLLLCYAITIALFFVTARYRIPLVPYLLIFSSVMSFKIIDNLTQKNVSFCTKALGLMIILIFFVNTDFYHTKRFHKIDYSWLYGTYANLDFESGNYRDAIKYYTLALKHDSKNTDAINGIGNVFLSLGKLEMAKNSFKVSLETERNVDALSKLGLIYLMSGDLDSARIRLSDALTIDSNSPEVHYYLGLYYAYNKNPRHAIRHLQSSLHLYPDPKYVRNIYRILSKLYLEIGDSVQATRYYKKAKKN